MHSLIEVPKVILHTHLEGSVPPETLSLLSSRNKTDLFFDPFGRDIYKLIEANNWNSFRKIYYMICECFKTEQDFFDALYGYGIKLHKENVVYAEVTFSPWKHLSRGISLETISRGLFLAVDQLEKDTGIIVRLICDLVRNKEEECDKIIFWMKELSKRYLVALGISGGTQAVERIRYQNYCKIAKENGFKITAHAGELEGAESVNEVLTYFYVDRIGHGIRSIENTDLLNSLISKNTHFEICPSANKIVGLCRNDFLLIKKFISMVVNFSINPDDELIFDTNIAKEIEIMVKENIILKNDISRLQKNALQNSFADELTKNKLLAKYFND